MTDEHPSDSAQNLPTSLPKREKRTLGIISFFGALTFIAGIVLAAYAFVNYQYEANLKERIMRWSFKSQAVAGYRLLQLGLKKTVLLKALFYLNWSQSCGGMSVILRPESFR